MDQNLKVILIRHAETEANTRGTIQGLSDSPLTPAGIDATLKKAEKVAQCRFAAVYCSDLPRAVETLRIMRDRLPHLPATRFREDLRDIDFGKLTGRSKEEIIETIRHHKANPTLPYPSGESGERFRSRVTSFFRQLWDGHQGETTLVVTHYGVIETAIRTYVGDGREPTFGPRGDRVYAMSFQDPSRATLKSL